jgi:hypothetical protein
MSVKDFERETHLNDIQNRARTSQKTLCVSFASFLIPNCVIDNETSYIFTYSFQIFEGFPRSSGLCCRILSVRWKRVSVCCDNHTKRMNALGYAGKTQS